MINVEIMVGQGVAEQAVEIVERKGKGHPDTICDRVMDSISVALSQAYLNVAGQVLHHNVDKGLLAAGSAEIGFGGGRVVKPMELLVGDRATFRFGGDEIPVNEIAESAARGWFTANLPHVNVERHLRVKLLLSPGSEELTGIFSRGDENFPANDTSAAVGFYPLSATENAVLSLEVFLNSPEFKGRFPQTGEDVKVMGLRHGGSLDVTVAMPLLAKMICDEKEYFHVKEAVRVDMVEFLRREHGFSELSVHYNALDEEGAGLKGVYLSLLGTSAENADSGQVGRGNRINGLISVNRPLGTEAAAGKNPVSHVGKIYNFLAHRLARMVYEEIEGVREVRTILLSRIGSPVGSPRITSVQVLPKGKLAVSHVRQKIEAVCERELARVPELSRELARGDYPVC